MLLCASRPDAKRLTPVKDEVLPCGQTRKRWYEGVTARVTFYERHEAIVRVVLERTQLLNAAGSIQQDVRQFYSIYEVARRRQGI